MQKTKSLDRSNSNRGLNDEKNRLTKPPRVPSSRNMARSAISDLPESPLQYYDGMVESSRYVTDERCIPREISFMSTVVDVAEMTKFAHNDDTTVSSSMDDLAATGENVRLIL
jgi:hypothetical protein